jgi:hypothetical protein
VQLTHLLCSSPRYSAGWEARIYAIVENARATTGTNERIDLAMIPKGQKLSHGLVQTAERKYRNLESSVVLFKAPTDHNFAHFCASKWCDVGYNAMAA